MIDLYTWKTPNGRKVSVMLAECGLRYNAHAVGTVGGEPILIGHSMGGFVVQKQPGARRGAGRGAHGFGAAARPIVGDLPRHGHVMMLEADWQKVADRIIEWMRAGELDRI